MDSEESPTRPSFLSSLILDSNNLIRKTSFPTSLALVMLLIHFFQFSMVTIDISTLNADGVYAHIFYYMNVALPHKLLTEFTTPIFLATLLANALVIVIAIYGFFVAKRFHKNIKAITFYFFFLNLVDLNLVGPLIGLNLSVLRLPNQLSAVVSGLGQVGLMAGTLVLVALQVTINIFFANFFITSKDPLCRSPSPIFIANKIGMLALLTVDVFIPRDSSPWLVNIMALVFSLYLLGDFVTRIPYSKMLVSITYLYSTLFFFWVNLMVTLGVNLKIELILDALFILVLIGAFFFVLALYCYRDTLQTYLLNSEFKTLGNENLIEKKIRLFYTLIKNSKKSKKDELRLASLIRFHVDTCSSPLCICQTPEKVFNAVKNQSSNPDLPIFKDSVLVKSIFLSMVQRLEAKIRGSEQLSIIYILLLLEVNHNLPLCGSECATFAKQFGRSASFLSRICLERIHWNLREQLKSFNRRSEIGNNKYELLVDYDTHMNDLK